VGLGKVSECRLTKFPYLSRTGLFLIYVDVVVWIPHILDSNDEIVRETTAIKLPNWFDYDTLLA
jgi:hypothetical protein